MNASVSSPRNHDDGSRRRSLRLHNKSDAKSTISPPATPRPVTARTLRSSSSVAALKKKPAVVTPRPPNDSTKRKAATDVGGNAKTKKRTGRRTQSFGALWHGSWTHDKGEAAVEPHTLILGTHPSVQSLRGNQYYGHPMNAFWWIAGDCLGFRRGTAISPATGKPYAFASQLRYSNILTYEQQVECFLRHGFALWDVVKACVRPGSLDQDITQEEPNDIQAFCEAHPSIRRIVLANGGTGSTFFVRHFREWLKSSGEFQCIDEGSQKVFKLEKRTTASITLISAISVSPAAARYSYQQKRDFWEEHVYQPGLADLQK